jgi:hypothetical protein
VYRLHLVLITALLLAGCSSLHVMSHVPLSTMSRLSSLQVSKIEPAALRVAARLPTHLEPRPVGVKVNFTIEAKETSKSEFVLEPAQTPAELAELSKFQLPGARLWSFRLSEADAARVLQLIKASPSDGRSSVSIGVDACHRGPLGTQPLPTTTLLRTDVSGYFVLTEDLDLRSVVSESDLASKVPPCDENR